MLHLPYTSLLFDEDGQIVAVCPELNVSSFGETPTEAVACLKEAIQLFLEECQHMATLEMVLEEAGYHRDLLTGRWVFRQPLQIHYMEAAFA